MIERPDLSQKEQASAHKEAEEVVREKLVNPVMIAVVGFLITKLMMASGIHTIK